MSRPTTPVRSIARSTPSTPPSTCNGASPPELTPRSKVKAILAAIDDDSDSEPTVRCQGQVRKVLSAVDAIVQEVDELKEVPQRDWLDEEEEQEWNEDEGDEESLCLPRGKLAAGLGRQAVHREDLSWNNEEAMDENAYARIRKRLISGNSKKLEFFAPISEDRAALGQKEGRTEATIPSWRNTPDLPSDHVPSALDSPVSRNSRQALSLKPEGESNALGLVGKTTNQGDSDSELPANPRSKQRLLELVARKKAEREAKRAAGDKKRKEKAAKQKAFEKELSEDATLDLGMSDEDSAADKMLTQHPRPTRKASKKAIEEISRETQRMSRNMQLAHQAKTKKKITKESFFARFNFRTTATSTLDNSQIPSSSTVASSAPASDLGEARDVQSPPTSPTQPENSIEKARDIDINKITASIDAAVHAAEQTGEDLPDLLDIMSQTALKLEKGNAKAVDRIYVETATKSKRGKEMAFTQPFIKIRAPSLSLGAKIIELDSDSDLEVVPTKKLRTSKADIFDRLPADNGQEGRSLQTLRALAHLTSPGRTRGKKATMSLADMQISLQRRARQQAIEERVAKIEDLRSRGIVVQTAEERQHDQAEVEDMIEKARREGDEIMQKEKRAAKKTKIANGEVDDLPDTSDEDHDYREDQGGEPEVELSGSEEGEGNDSEGLEESIMDVEETENEDEEGGISVNKSGPWRKGMLVDEASEDGNDGEEQEEEEVKALAEDDEQPNEAKLQRSCRKRMVIDDDDDADDEDDQAEKSMTPLQTENPVIDTPALPENPFKSNGIPMGMTQAFAATMANSQTQADDKDEEQDSMAMFDFVPEPNVPMFDTNDSLDSVEDSQVGLQGPSITCSKDIELQFSQSQIRYNALGDTQDLHTGTQLSEIPDPTQDIGFALSSPAPKNRFMSEPPSTVDTVLLSGVAGDGSPVKKRGRLHRRVVVEEALSDTHESPTTTSLENNAFDAMRKATKVAKAAAAKEAFDKKKSEAKGMVEEQAQESEDEYAGLGGASDEDSGEEDEDVKAMMDHGEINVDESKLAGFHA